MNHDILRKVDGKSLEGCIIERIIYNVRGKKGTELLLTLERDGKEFEVYVTRGLIRREYVQSWPSFELPEGRGSTGKTLRYTFPLLKRTGEEAPSIAYIKVISFEYQTAIDLYYVLSEMPWDEISGLIVDMRGNPGGELFTTVAAAGYFLPPSTIVVWRQKADGQLTRNRTPSKLIYDQGRGFYHAPNTVPEDLPVVVIVNQNSYSAAELFAAALQDHKRVVLVGARTGGKGTVNGYFPLRGGEYGDLYLATEIWKTPNGTFIQPLHETEEGGLLPDVVVEQPLDGFSPDNDENIFRAIEILLGE